MTVIILTGETRHAEVDYALKLGARAVVSKSDPPEAILAACDAALAGEVYVSPQMVEALGKYRQPPVALSPRQMAFPNYLAHGEDRLSVGQGKRGAGRVDLGGGRIT